MLLSMATILRQEVASSGPEATVFRGNSGARK